MFHRVLMQRRNLLGLSREELANLAGVDSVTAERCLTGLPKCASDSARLFTKFATQELPPGGGTTIQQRISGIALAALFADINGHRFNALEPNNEVTVPFFLKAYDAKKVAAVLGDE